MIPRLFKPFGFVKKHGRQGAGLFFPICLFSLYIYIENFKNILVRNNWTDFHIILQNCSFGDSLLRLFKPFGFVKKYGHQGAGLFSLYIYIENFKNLLVRNHWTDFHILLQKCSFGDPLPSCSSHLDSSKNMAARGWVLFSLYIYIENLKNLLIRNHYTDFNIICRNVPLVILYQDCSCHLDLSKNMAARGRCLFSLCIYIENLKNLLVRNHWTDFHIISQKCSFGDSLPRLFKPFGFVKKTWPPGDRAYFPYISI